MEINNFFTKIRLKRKNFLFSKKSFVFFLLILCISTNTFFKISANEVKEQSLRFNNLANQLRCPTCQGLSIKDSEAGFSNIIKG